MGFVADAVPTERSRAGLWPALVVLGLAACAHVPSAGDRMLGENYYDQGVIAVTENRPQQAMKLFQDSIEKNPGLAEPHNALGLLYWWSFGRSVDARSEFDQALLLKPDFADAANNLGTLLTELKDYKGARAAYEKALSEPMYRTPYVAQTNLGWALHLDGQDAAAEQTIRTALAAEPSYCVGHRQLARLLDATGREKDGETSWERFAQLCPNDPEALLRNGMLLAKRGQALDASRELTKCIEKAAARPVGRECRDALALLPPLPVEAVEPPDPARAGDAGQGVRGSRDLGGAH